MLGKLFKYEFKACGRQLFSLYGAVLVFAVMLGLSINRETFGVLGEFSTIAFFSGCTAVAVVTLFMVIRRFTRNVLGDEGYLTMTLPVRTEAIIGVKLMNAILYVGFGMITAFLAFSLIGITQGWRVDFPELGQFLRQAIVYENGSGAVMGLNMLASGILALAETVLMVYLSAAIGQLGFADKHRSLASVGAFVVLGMVIPKIYQLLAEMPIVKRLVIGVFYGEHSTQAEIFHELNLLIGLGNVIMLVSCAVLFAATNYILKNHLNL